MESKILLLACAATSLILSVFIPVHAYGADGAPVPGKANSASALSPASDRAPVPGKSANSSICTTSWKELRNPVYLTDDKKAIFYSFVTSTEARVYLVVAEYKSGHYAFRPIIAPVKTAVSVTANEKNALAAVNAAYFNLSDGLSVGYIYADGNMIADPQKNLALYENEKLRPYLPAVFNRTEVRFLVNAYDEPQIQIVPHKEPLPPECKLVDSLQAGPRLLPKITEEEEAFIRKDPDSGKIIDAINSHKSAARTAFGITNDGYALMLCVSSPSQNRESTGVTLTELAEIMQGLGCVEAINFDGGASTTMAVNLHHETESSQRLTVVCGKDPETRVKSILILVRK
jgi:hypothetical protein